MVKVTTDTKVKAKPAVKVEDIKVASRISSPRQREGQEHDGQVHRGRRGRGTDEVACLRNGVIA